jgi:predicted DNA-binding protein YlxM (UPF0122 family)
MYKMCDKNKIYSMYIIEKMTITEIAKEENVSKQMISKILKEFPEYEIEKEKRKAENALKRKEKALVGYDGTAGNPCPYKFKKEKNN